MNLDPMKYHFPEITASDEPLVYSDPEDYNWPEDDFQDWIDMIDRAGFPDLSNELWNEIRPEAGRPYARISDEHN